MSSCLSLCWVCDAIDTFTCGPFTMFHPYFLGHWYLQQDLGHLWDLGDHLGQEDPEHKQEKVTTTSHKCTQKYYLWFLSKRRIVKNEWTLLPITHLFSLVGFASFLTGLSDLSLEKRNTHTNSQPSELHLASSSLDRIGWVTVVGWPCHRPLRVDLEVQQDRADQQDPGHHHDQQDLEALSRPRRTRTLVLIIYWKLETV